MSLLLELISSGVTGNPLLDVSPVPDKEEAGE